MSARDRLRGLLTRPVQRENGVFVSPLAFSVDQSKPEVAGAAVLELKSAVRVLSDDRRDLPELVAIEHQSRTGVQGPQVLVGREGSRGRDPRGVGHSSCL